jgi:hypothetical protein
MLVAQGSLWDLSNFDLNSGKAVPQHPVYEVFLHVCSCQSEEQYPIIW